MELSTLIIYIGFISGTIGGIFIVHLFSKFAQKVGGKTNKAFTYIKIGVILNFLGWFFQVPEIDDYLHLSEIHDILMFLQTVPFLMASKELVNLVSTKINK
ncbi:hypothetical protein HRbin34_00107 [bacterium HR34]|nr:hypothetical protein HRbin34_00107 [bacterium HR34]